jgi:hypothetical protein
LVLRLLAEYPTQSDLGAGSLAQMTPLERRRFVREYIEIGVSLESGGMLELCRIDHHDPEGRTGEGRNEDAVRIPVTCSAREFVEAIDQVSG